MEKIVLTDGQGRDILGLIDGNIIELQKVREQIESFGKAFHCAELERDMVRKQNDHLLISLKDCANELCCKCGKSANEHLGACDGCKWKDVKNWEVD